MPDKLQFFMIGGFLGAGKTTAIADIATRFIAAGKRVALVTNDQANNLVDTMSLRSQGFEVGEVPGACFCCKFDDLVETISGLSAEGQPVPDIVIAEPVGSCTDLVATVIEPMRELFGERFEVGAVVVLLKPEHGLKILGEGAGKGFSPKAEYIFLKQLEEADAIVINKVDKLSADQQATLSQAIAKRFPDVESVFASARTGQNMDAVMQMLTSGRRKRSAMMSVDYAVYAEGEAELGWLNCQVEATADAPFSLDSIVTELVCEIGQRLEQIDCEIAHLKVLGQTLQSTSVANRVASGSEAELSLASEVEVLEADLLVNARVAAEPKQLATIVEQAARQLEVTMRVSLVVRNVQSFRPGKPEPTHRKS